MIVSKLMSKSVTFFFFFHEFFSSSSCNQCKNGPPRRHIEFKLFLLSSAVTRHQFCGFSKDFVAQYRNRKWGFEVRSTRICVKEIKYVYFDLYFWLKFYFLDNLMTKLSFSVTLYWKKHAEDERYGDNFGYYVVRVHHSKAHKGTFANLNFRKI